MVTFSNGGGTVSSGMIPEKAKLSRKYHPRPQLEKIGGLDKEVKKYLSNHIDMMSAHTQIMRTSLPDSIKQLPSGFNTIVNLKRLNDIKEINRFLYTLNSYLPQNGVFVGCAETKFLRRKRIFKSLPPGISHLFYLFDFMLRRVIPKLNITRRLYFYFTAGRNKVMSKTETLGRLYAAGYEVLDTQFVKDSFFFVARKIKKPLFDYEPVYGPIFKMRRHGKGGKIIHVYKMRTMHAYSEFIQQYVYEKNKLDEGGKLKDDFRVSTAGKIFRKFWIDELPMVLNMLKGDLKIVGVRPLSSHYLSLYSDELKNMRKQTKPGLLPPFYVDLPKTLQEIEESELKYLRAHQKSPLMTDMKYFFMIFYTILVKRARSK